jgi:hypothetical protein
MQNVIVLLEEEENKAVETSRDVCRGCGCGWPSDVTDVMRSADGTSACHFPHILRVGISFADRDRGFPAHGADPKGTMMQNLLCISHVFHLWQMICYLCTLWTIEEQFHFSSTALFRWYGIWMRFLKS